MFNSFVMTIYRHERGGSSVGSRGTFRDAQAISQDRVNEIDDSTLVASPVLLQQNSLGR